MKKMLIYIFIVMTFLAGCAQAESVPSRAELPAGKAFAEGKVIYFVHTEASDADIAEKLTGMMKSPVLHVPALADVPDSSLANVFVFSNGLTGSGPLGFQPDVFDNPPGTPGYSPLRRLNVITWTNPSEAVELKSAGEIVSLQQSGKITIETPGIVINMPFILWDGGKR